LAHSTKKHHNNNLLSFVQYEVQNADNTTTLRIWSDVILCEVHATNNFRIVKG